MPNRSLPGFDAADMPIAFNLAGPRLGLRQVERHAKHGIRDIQAAIYTLAEGWARDRRVEFVNAAP